jgi:hypothetical protein
MVDVTEERKLAEPSRLGREGDDSRRLAEMFSPWQAKAIAKLVEEGKAVPVVQQELVAIGFDVSEKEINDLSKNLRGMLVDQEKNEQLQGLLLNSVERVAKDFETINEKTKNILDRIEKQNFGQGNPMLELIVVKELREQLKLVLVKLGAIEKATVNVQNVNVISGQDMVDRFRKMQVAQFEVMCAELVDGRLVYNKPSSELVDAFNRWSYLQRRGDTAVDADFVKSEAVNPQGSGNGVG